MRKPLIAGNWKMNKTINESIELVNSLKREFIDIDTAEILICPTYISLSEVSDLVCDSNVSLGAQNVYWEESGAFTGEISPLMLKDVGCSYVIIGHSERRKYFSETDETVNKKIKAAQKANLTPIVCVGETLEERESQKTISVIEGQLKRGFKDLGAGSISKLIIAYEPVWAIGTGKTATPQIAQEVHEFIRSWVKNNYSQEVSDGIRILYGGSVKPDTTKDLMSQKDIDGFLVGGASLDASSFTEIVKNSL